MVRNRAYLPIASLGFLERFPARVIPTPRAWIISLPMATQSNAFRQTAKPSIGDDTGRIAAIHRPEENKHTGA
jgi:hypothetical protein